MPDSRRVQRVSTVLQEEISRLLLESMADPRLSRLVTVVSVRVTPDLEHATVGVTVLDAPAEQAAALRALNDATGYLRRELGVRMRLRRVPSLRFVADEAVSAGDRVLGLLDTLPPSAGTTGTDSQEAPQDG